MLLEKKPAVLVAFPFVLLVPILFLTSCRAVRSQATPATQGYRLSWLVVETFKATNRGWESQAHASFGIQTRAGNSVGHVRHEAGLCSNPLDRGKVQPNAFNLANLQLIAEVTNAVSIMINDRGEVGSSLHHLAGMDPIIFEDKVSDDGIIRLQDHGFPIFIHKLDIVSFPNVRNDTVITIFVAIFEVL